MITTEIGKDGNLEVSDGDPLLVERMRRDFHHHGVDGLGA
jgi:hypothetical protein